MSACACGSTKKPEARTCLRCYRAAHSRSLARPATVRFMDLVDASAGMFACWTWIGQIDRNGYGRFHLDGRLEWAHRAAYRLFVGPIPADQEVRHLVCDNPPCVSPAHLALGTHLENVHDATSKGRNARGEAMSNHKLTAAQVVAIREEYAAGGVLMREIAARVGVSDSAIKKIIRRELWAHV